MAISKERLEELIEQGATIWSEFWNYMRKLSKTHTVFISEEKAPDDFECIWSKEVKRVLDVNKSNIQPKVEKLFIYKGENKNV